VVKRAAGEEIPDATPEELLDLSSNQPVMRQECVLIPWDIRENRLYSYLVFKYTSKGSPKERHLGVYLQHLLGRAPNVRAAKDEATATKVLNVWVWFIKRALGIKYAGIAGDPEFHLTFALVSEQRELMKCIPDQLEGYDVQKMFIELQ
jgi:hypothetical protein